MSITNPSKKPQVSVGGAGSSRHVASGAFSGKTVAVAEQKDAESFLAASDANQSLSIQQSTPVAPQKAKHKVKLPSAETNFPQATNEPIYDTVKYEPVTTGGVTHDCCFNLQR